MYSLGLFHSCILEAHNTFGFTGAQLERNLPQDELYLGSHPRLIR